MKEKLLLAVVIFALVDGIAAAQGLSPEQSAAAALGQQIGLLSYENSTLRNQIALLQGQLGTAQRHIKELTDKYEKPGEAPDKR